MGDDTTKTLTELQRVRAAPPTADGPLHQSGEAVRQGMTLGRYLVLYRVGSGGMGVVYAAYDPDLDRKVAVKVLRRHQRGGAYELARLEAQAMAKLAHPNVVTVHDVGAHDGELFIAMEFVTGRTLKAWLQEEEPPWPEVVEKFVLAGRGLAAAHRAGLVHRDFKPSNVMLSDEGDVKVLDFGLAEYQDAASQSEPRDPPLPWQGLVGTLAYLPPERLQGRDDDPRSDQFSFSAALWHALYGNLPFPVQRLQDYPQRVQQTPQADQAARSVPNWLRQALLRGLSATPEKRFGDLQEMLRTISPERRRWRRRRRQGAVGAVLVALTLGIIWQRNAPADPCSSFDQRLQGVWDDQRREAVRQSFLASGVGFAESAWHSTSQLLDAYSEGWLEQRIEACEATHIRQEQSASLLDQRMACLDRHFEQFRALSDVLAQANAATVIDAVQAAGHLESLSACRDGAQLSRRPPLPQDPALRQSIDTVRADVERQLARQRFHQTADIESLRRSVVAAEALDHAPIRARAHYALGWIEGQRAARQKAAEHLIKAAQLARIAADPAQEIQAFTALVKLESRPPVDFPKADMWLAFAESQLQALGDGYPELELAVAEAAGWLAFARDDPQVASHWGRALELAEQIWGAESPRVASVLADLSLLGTPQRETYLRRAMHLITSWYGAEHPALAPHLSNLAAFEAARGNYREAIELARRALDVLPSAAPLGAPKRAYPLALLAQLYNAVDRPEIALDYLPEARQALAQAAAETDDLALKISLTAGRAAILLGDLSAATDALQDSERLLRERVRDRRRRNTAQIPLLELQPTTQQLQASRLHILSRRGWIMAQEGRPEAARSLHQAVLSSLQQVAAPQEDQADWLLNAAESLILEGRLDQAYPLTRDALTRIDGQRDPRQAARGHFAAAQCLRTLDPVAARLRAEQAREALGGDETPRRRLRAQIDQWMDEALPDTPTDGQLAG